MSNLSIPPTKRCTKCGEEFLTTLEFFDKHNRGKYGLHPYCKSCRREYANQYASSRKLDPLYRESVRLYQRQYTKRPHADMKRREYRKKNYPNVRQAALDRAKLPKQKQRQREYDKRTRQLPHRRIKDKLNGLKRRTLERSLPFNFTHDMWIRCLEYWNYRCCVCGKPQGFWHIIAKEHWIPVNDSRIDNPGTVSTNILPMCHSRKDGEGGCNNNKHNKHPELWLIERVGKKRAKQILDRISAYFEWVKQQD